LLLLARKTEGTTEVLLFLCLAKLENLDCIKQDSSGRIVSLYKATIHSEPQRPGFVGVWLQHPQEKLRNCRKQYQWFSRWVCWINSL